MKPTHPLPAPHWRQRPLLLVLPADLLRYSIEEIASFNISMAGLMIDKLSCTCFCAK